jgi:hypothetical protein
MNNETITIATETGPRETIGRATPVPGLAITGARGSYAITHAPSGLLVCRASLANTQVTLEHIRNAMMLATMVDMTLDSVIDWTVQGDELDRPACVDWLRAFFSHLRLGL